MGIFITNTLDWSPQVNNMCLKANKKLSVLRSVKLLSRKTLDVLYKLTVRSVIDYGLFIYFHNLKQSDVHRVEQIQYKAGQVVTGALPLTSRLKLNNELSWESIADRAKFLGLTFFHKIRRQLTRPLIRSCMPQPNFNENYNLRQANVFKPFLYYNQRFSKSFFPFFTKLYNNLPVNIQCKADIDEFKSELGFRLKPDKFKHFSKGNKIANKYLSRLRMGRSSLNAHTFSIGLSESPKCQCNSTETVEHYLHDCSLFTVERQKMFSLVEHYLTTFQNMRKKRKVDILLNGFKPSDYHYDYVNLRITLAVQNYIINTKRFDLT